MEWDTTAYDCDERVVVNPSWLTPTVTAFAQRISEEGDFGLMPILADALLEAGCENEEVLTHCRVRGRHVRELLANRSFTIE